MDIIDTIKALDIQDFAILCAVYETQSYTQAAQQAKTTVTTCRRVIEKLERITGYNIVQVHTNAIRVMPEAEALYQTAKKLLQQSHVLLHKVYQNQKIKLYLGAYIAMLLTQSSEIFSLQPQWNIDISTYSQMVLQNYGLLAKHVIDHYDLIVISSEFEHLIDAALWVPKYRKNYDLKLYASAKYLDVHGTPQDICDLVKHRCIGSKIELIHGWNLKDQQNNYVNLSNNATMYFDTIFAKHSAAINDLGIACLTDEVISHLGRASLLPVLAEHDLGHIEIVIYVKSDLQHPQLNPLLKVLKSLLQ